MIGDFDLDAARSPLPGLIVPVRVTKLGGRPIVMHVGVITLLSDDSLGARPPSIAVEDGWSA
jgi:hypothetical protein